MRLDDDGLRRSRARAHLLHPPKGRGVDAIVSSLVGVQAQDAIAASLAIRARGRGRTAEDVHSALIDTRSVVLVWSLRGTRHIHRADDIRWLLDLLGPRFAAGNTRRARALGIAGDVGTRAVGTVRDALAADGPLTRSEIKERLARVGVDPAGQAPVHVLHRAALEGVLCVVPSRDGDETYVALDDWVPASPPVPPETATAELARRYLRGYGPAAPADLATWSGLPLAAAKAAWGSIAGELTEVPTSRGPSWTLKRLARGLDAAAHRAGGVRLLGAFDDLLLGYADRELLVASHARDVNAGGGIVRPTVLADGRIVGTWARRRGGIEFTWFAGPRDDVDAEVRDVERFLGG